MERASILDLAPTILYAMGLPVLKEFDGRVLQECFTDERLGAGGIEPVPDPAPVGSSVEAGDEAGDVYSREEQKDIIEQLEAFGYK